MNETQPDTMVAVHPTDVWVCLRSGVWNLTNPEPTDQRIPSRTTRAILRGLLLAAIETLDEIDTAALMPKSTTIGTERLSY